MKKCLHLNDAKKAARERAAAIAMAKRARRSKPNPIRTVPIKMLWPDMSRRERIAANMAAAGVPLEAILSSALAAKREGR